MKIRSLLVKSALALGIVILAVATATAAAPVKVDGTLIGPGIPPYWRLIGAALVGHDSKIYIRVDAEGNCHTEWRQECNALPNGGVVCHQVPYYVCDQTYALYLMPSTVRIDGKSVLWNSGSADLKIGEVKSFLFWKWIALRDGANIQAGYNTAALVLDTGRLTAGTLADRAANFERIYGAEKTVDLVVGFQGATNHAARELIRGAGYAGDFADANTWTGADPTRDQIGIRVSPSEGAALISRLQGNALVTGIKPYASQ
ncbi:MAG: hypothetical protein HY303_14665 [Candidatus Wallbacteria bacterium]|nr:hypothetical protein [Candidatus Wallbacteria bacterium]